MYMSLEHRRQHACKRRFGKIGQLPTSDSNSLCAPEITIFPHVVSGLPRIRTKNLEVTGKGSDSASAVFAPVIVGQMQNILHNVTQHYNTKKPVGW